MKELRCLVFTDQEVVGAILDRRRRRREPGLPGTVTGISYQAEDGLDAVLDLMTDQGDTESMTVPEHEVTAALVAYCMNRRIPLPADADKFLYLVNDNLTLMITLNFNRAPRLVSDADGRHGRGRRILHPITQ